MGRIISILGITAIVLGGVWFWQTEEPMQELGLENWQDGVTAIKDYGTELGLVAPSDDEVGSNVTWVSGDKPSGSVIGQRKIWVEGKSKEECLGNHRTLDDEYIRCRNGYEALVNVYQE